MNQPIKVVMLPTEDKTNIKLDPDRIRLWYDSTPMSTEIHKHQHIYITVSQDVEPIEDGEWGLTTTNHVIRFDKEKMSILKGIDARKIIATTDKKLTGVAQVQQSFIKEYVANPDGEWEVEYEYDCERHPELEGAPIIEEWNWLKLNQDNEVNITSSTCRCKGSGGIRMDGTCARCGKPLEEKMYNLNTLEQSCMYFANTTYVWTIEEVRDWIKENL